MLVRNWKRCHQPKASQGGAMGALFPVVLPRPLACGGPRAGPAQTAFCSAFPPARQGRFKRQGLRGAQVNNVSSARRDRSPPPFRARLRRRDGAGRSMRGGGVGVGEGREELAPLPRRMRSSRARGGGTAGEHAQWRPAQPLYRGGGAAVEPHCRRARGRWRGGFSASSGSWRPVGVPDGPGLRFLLPFPLTFSPGGLGTVFPQHRGPARAGAG